MGNNFPASPSFYRTRKEPFFRTNMAEVVLYKRSAETLWAERTHYRNQLKDRTTLEEKYFLRLVSSCITFPKTMTSATRYARRGHPEETPDFHKSLSLPSLSSPLTYEERCKIWEHQLKFTALHRVVIDAISSRNQCAAHVRTFTENISNLEQDSLDVILWLQALYNRSKVKELV